MKKTKKKRLLKKLINIECKNEEKLKSIKYQRERQLHIIDIGEKYNWKQMKNNKSNEKNQQ